MIKSVVFDFDGVIAESVDIKTRAFAAVFKDFPDQIEKIVNFHLAYQGVSRFEKFKLIYDRILHQPLSESQSAELGRKFSEYVYQQVIKCPLVKGASDFLNKYHKKLLFFVVSATPQEEIRSIVKARKLEAFFQGVYGSPGDKGNQILNILKQYCLEPAEVIFVGDTISDYEGARTAGVKFIGRVIKEKANPFAKLKTAGIIANLSELAQIMEQ